MEIPTGEHVEEVNLMEYSPREGGGHSHRGEAYHEDDDDDGAGPRVQCAHQ